MMKVDEATLVQAQKRLRKMGAEDADVKLSEVIAVVMAMRDMYHDEPQKYADLDVVIDQIVLAQEPHAFIS